MSQRTGYEPEPSYPAASGRVGQGWSAVRDSAPQAGTVLAIEGPMLLDWGAVIVGMCSGRDRVSCVDMREATVRWEMVLERTAPVEELADDPDFATITAASLADLFDDVPVIARQSGTLTVVVGPGSSLVEHDILWYADLPKRFAEAETTAGRGRNLGQPEEVEASTRRLFYIDWPMLDRHREQIAAEIDLWIDMREPSVPTSIGGDDLRGSLAQLSQRPFRTRPTFNTTPWGGHWAQQQLGMNTAADNTALGYELIAPESGILIGSVEDGMVEIPFQLLVGCHPRAMLGESVYEVFGTSFPIRFDYLDTFGGGSLSVHCHPQPDYMRDIFGWPYAQHETYYVMVGSTDNVVYLGLNDDVDVAVFQRQASAAAEQRLPFDIERFVQSHPAAEHQLFLIPAGTPHGSGKDNVVLEISATPYLYSLRFYDWLRRNSDEQQRPVHVDHAFRNLDATRSGSVVRETLIQQPRPVLAGDGWSEELIGELPDMFFEVHRLQLEPGAVMQQHTNGRFHVLNVVAGQSIRIDTERAGHVLSFAETIVVPAAVGSYQVTSTGDEPVRVVKAFVR